jgi:hypothetical protein
MELAMNFLGNIITQRRRVVVRKIIVDQQGED